MTTKVIVNNAREILAENTRAAESYQFDNGFELSCSFFFLPFSTLLSNFEFRVSSSRLPRDGVEFYSNDRPRMKNCIIIYRDCYSVDSYRRILMVIFIE